jgi:hypothetical protein
MRLRQDNVEVEVPVPSRSAVADRIGNRDVMVTSHDGNNHIANKLTVPEARMLFEAALGAIEEL